MDFGSLVSYRGLDLLVVIMVFQFYYVNCIIVLFSFQGKITQFCNLYFNFKYDKDSRDICMYNVHVFIKIKCTLGSR